MTVEHAPSGPQGRPTPERPATGFLIDPAARRIAPWLYNGDWQTIAPAIRNGRSPFTIVEIDDGDVIYVDDEVANRVVVMSARPGLIKCDLPVPLEHPRHYSVKTTPVFMDLKARLTQEIRIEVQRAAGLGEQAAIVA